MAHHHHRHHHQQLQEENSAYDATSPADAPYSQSPYQQSPYVNPAAAGYGHEFPPSSYDQEQGEQRLAFQKLEEEEKAEKRREHFGEAAALASGAFAMYEAHEVKVDSENARRHKIEEEVAAAAAVGAGGYTLYEHHEIKKTEHREEEVEGKKHHRHHLF